MEQSGHLPSANSSANPTQARAAAGSAVHSHVVWWPADDDVTDENIRRYTRMESRRILRHIADLEREWDIERVMKASAGGLAVAGVALGLGMDRKWFALPVMAGLFMLQHRLLGRCPPQRLLSGLGFRPRAEIEMEKHVLQGHIRPLD